MRRWAIASLIVLGLALSFSTGTTGEKEKPEAPITISYHGQSFFILTTSKGKRIAFDPHFIKQYGKTDDERTEPGLKADIALISHNHNDHVQVQVLENFTEKGDKGVRVIRGLQGTGLKATWAVVNETIDDITIRNVPVYHDDSEGLIRGKNSIFIVEVDGWRVAHLGDLGHLLSPATVKRIGKVDVLMIPCGGIYTLNGAEAKKVMEQLKPKEYVFPMHYGTKEFDPILSVDEFLDGQEKRQVAISDHNVLKLNKDAQRPRPLTVVLNIWPKEVKKAAEVKQGVKKDK